MSYYVQLVSPGTTGSVCEKAIISGNGDPLAAAYCINTLIKKVDIAVSVLDLHLLFNVIFKEIIQGFRRLSVDDGEQTVFSFPVQKPDGEFWYFRRDDCVKDKPEFLQGYIQCAYRKILEDDYEEWIDHTDISIPHVARIGIDIKNRCIFIGAYLGNDENVFLLYRAYKEILEGFVKLGVSETEADQFHFYHERIYTPTGTAWRAIIN